MMKQSFLLVIGIITNRKESSELSVGMKLAVGTFRFRSEALQRETGGEAVAGSPTHTHHQTRDTRHI